MKRLCNGRGNYLINVVQYKDGKVILSKSLHCIFYSDEYDVFLSGGNNTVASNANGEVWDNIHDILK